MSLFDDVVEAAKKVNPDFDENNSEDLDIMTKSFVLSQLETEHGKELYDNYLVTLVEEKERQNMRSIIEQKKYSRQELISARLRMVQLEKDIAEHQLKVLREFMD